MKSEETDTQNTLRGMTPVWYSIIPTQMGFSVEKYDGILNRLWAKVMEKALQMYAGHRQQHGLTEDSENVFSNHISLKNKPVCMEGKAGTFAESAHLRH